MRTRTTKRSHRTDASVAPVDLSSLYSTDTLADLIGVPPQRVCLWISSGLLEPTATAEGQHYFDFKQIRAAQTLKDLADAGASVRKLRRGMKRLTRWLPDPRPHERIVPGQAALHVRLDQGELAELDGQLRLDFADDDDEASVPFARSPQTADGWFALGAAQEAAGEVHEAIEAYRAALRVGGASVKVTFSLAHALAEAGLLEQAAERYAQVLELDPTNVDAWNNVGVVLCALGQHDAACRAYRQALEIRPDDARAHYNLADTLVELGRRGEALSHWRAYLRIDPSGACAVHAQRQLATV